MSNMVTPSGATQVIKEEVKVASRLSDDSSPVLSGDLNANGYNIEEVNNIDAKMVNGRNLSRDLDTLEKVVQNSFTTFAGIRHKHTPDDVEGLLQSIDGKIEASAIATRASCDSKFCTKTHTHTTHDIVGLIELIKSTIDSMGVAPHEHKDTQQNIRQLVGLVAEAASMKELREEIKKRDTEQVSLQTSIKEMDARCNDLATKLDNAMRELKESNVIHIAVKESSKSIVKKINTDSPYIVLDELPAYDSILVTDTNAQELEFEILPSSGTASLINFKKTKGPYTITFIIKK